MIDTYFKLFACDSDAIISLKKKIETMCKIMKFNKNTLKKSSCKHLRDCGMHVQDITMFS